MRTASSAPAETIGGIATAVAHNAVAALEMRTAAFAATRGIAPLATAAENQSAAAHAAYA